MNSLRMVLTQGEVVLADERQAHYDRLLAASNSPLSSRERAGVRGHHPNTQPLAEILASWRVGDGALPQWLGLGQAAFLALHCHYFGSSLTEPLQPARSTLDPRLDDLRDDLLRLLMANARDDSQATAWIAELLICACQGSRHLWEDLGVWNRGSLSQLLYHNFPSLAERNVRDMKWKKFLFKQLCETEGIYICRAPSCDECDEFDLCFGPE